MISSLAWGQVNIDIAENGDFENWTDGIPDNWYGATSSISNSNVVEYTSSVYSGSKACQLINTTATHKRFTTNSFSIDANVEYTVTYYARGKGEIRNAFYRNSNYSSYSDYTVLDTDSWTEIVWTFQYNTAVSDVEVIFSVINTDVAKDHIQIDAVTIDYVSGAIGVIFISEIADAVSDYNAEYIELYNNSSDIIDLSDSKIVMDQGPNFLFFDYDGDTQIPANGLLIMARGATEAEFESEWGALPGNCNYNKGVSSMYFGTSTARRWQLVFDDGSKADIIIDDTQTTVAGEGNRTYQNPVGSWNTDNRTNATLGELDLSQTLPVTLSTFTAQYLNSKPTLYWQTQSEEDNMSWFIYRNNVEDFTSSEKISDMIDGHGSTTEPQDYIYEDTSELQVEQTYYYWLESVDYSGTVHHYDRVAQVTIPHPDDPGQNVTPPVAYDISADPNPFAYTTEITFAIDQISRIDVAIYNVKGQLVKSFGTVMTNADEEVSFQWNGKDNAGKSLSNGVYLYSVKVNGKDYATKQLILMK